MTRSDHRAKHVTLAWVAFSFGVAATALIPIPFLNNIGAILGVIGTVMAVISVFGTKKLLSSFALGLCLLGLIGTVMIQKSWDEDFQRIQRDIDRELEQEFKTRDRITEDYIEKNAPTFTYDDCMRDLNDESACWAVPTG